jgi:nickel-dependent lactate racemase
MAVVDLKYGQDEVFQIQIDEKNYCGTIKHAEIKAGTGLNEALASPIESLPLKNIIKSDEKIAIVTSDITRPCPSNLILPKILKELELAGARDEDITIIFALGDHRFHSDEEKEKLVGKEIYTRYRCIDSDSNNVVFLGNTKNGTPLEIFRPVVEADRRILIGNVEYHYFAGYSGGVKAIVPGCASSDTIQINHSMMVKTNAQAGEIQKNPIRQDLEEILDFLSVDFIVNVTLNEKKEILAAFAGHPIHAHRKAVEYLDSLYKVKMPEPADIVIASAGGYPKDINLYQAQKAIDNASKAVRSGGILILIAECSEGYGNKTFEKWALQANKPKDLLDRVHSKFELGGHKSAAIAMVLEKNVSIYIISALSKELANQIFLEPFSSFEKAYHKALEVVGKDAKVMVIPQAGSVLPIILHEPLKK